MRRCNLSQPVFRVLLGLAICWTGRRTMALEPAVEAVDFQSQMVYQSQRPPGYAAWASFFPGHNGRWYLGCEEVSLPDNPLPQASPEHWFGMGLPAGYDKSQYLMEAVLLESTDNLKTWNTISREPYRHQHTVGQFAMAHTRDGRFLRFNWACYALDPAVKTNDILRVSSDNGQTWKPSGPFCSDRFAYHPHRLRTLRDGTLVLCMPYAPRWGKGTNRTVRHAMQLNANNEMKMTLFFSFDQGFTWQGPLAILEGETVSETDFVELPNGHLLFFNNSIFANPGRQFVYRNGRQFMPGSMEFVRSGKVPETVCLTNGVLVGCRRPGGYFWSDDLGQTWNLLQGVAGNGEVYQPWIHALADGRVACAGHFGGDDPIGQQRRHENSMYLHTFRVQVNRRTRDTKIHVERDYDANRRRWLNTFTIRLTSDGEPLPDRELEFWYVERYKPGYDGRNSVSLAERMKTGGTLLRPKTDTMGQAHVQLPDRFNKITKPHLSYQLVVRFNMDHSDPTSKPFQTPQLQFYSFAPMPPNLKKGER